MHFTVEAQSIIERHVASVFNDRAIYGFDATAGNGFDTLFLARLVRDNGRVLAMDVQRQAIEAATNKLIESNLVSRVDIVNECHSHASEYFNSCSFPSLNVAMFNLGYLPFGDKTIITKKETTLIALQSSFDFLCPHGIMSILSYPGHRGGSEEHSSVCHWIDSQGEHSSVVRYQDDQNPNSPVLAILIRNP